MIDFFFTTRNFTEFLHVTDSANPVQKHITQQFILLICKSRSFEIVRHALIKIKNMFSS